jgi:Flp pilus assembly protein TadD
MSDPAASKLAREEGNAHFRRGRWADAASAYGRAIAADENDALPRANRALAYLKLDR